jgi:hypothetical protein
LSVIRILSILPPFLLAGLLFVDQVLLSEGYEARAMIMTNAHTPAHNTVKGPDKGFGLIGRTKCWDDSFFRGMTGNGFI